MERSTSEMQRRLSSFQLEGVVEKEVELGHGSYASVFEVHYRGLKCAAKKIHKFFYEQGVGDQLKRFEEECRLLASLRHPNIVQFIGVFSRPDTVAPVLVMEFLPFTLKQCLHKHGILPEEISYGIFHDVALGLHYLHQHSPPIIHRDLSANNVLLSRDMVAKISDLGMAKLLNLSPVQKSTLTSTPGTPAYMPPEAMCPQPCYDTSIDVFSYGVLLLHTLSSQWPFPIEANRVGKQNVLQPVSEAGRRQQYIDVIRNDHPLLPLLHQCLSNSTQQRPTSSDILDQVAKLANKHALAHEDKVEQLKDKEKTNEQLRMSRDLVLSLKKQVADLQKPPPHQPRRQAPPPPSAPRRHPVSKGSENLRLLKLELSEPQPPPFPEKQSKKKKAKASELVSLNPVTKQHARSRSVVCVATGNDGKAVVIDVGSGMCKAGFSGKFSPEATFPSIMGYDRKRSSCFIGNDAHSKRGALSLTYPVERGTVTDWSNMEKIYDHIFKHELRVNSNEHPIMLAETPLNPKASREKTTELMFETFHSPALFIANSGTLLLHSTGCTTGVAVSSGEGVTYAVPVYDGHSIPHATIRLDLGGRDLTQYLTKLLAQHGCLKVEREVVNDIKTVCYMALDFECETKLASGTGLETRYMLPDGRTIFLNDQRFRCPEALFQPSLVGKQCPGLHQCCYDSIVKSESDIRKDLFANIVVSGGSTMFPFLDERLQKEMTALALPTMSAKVTAAPSRKYGVWIGGALLASQSSVESSWISKAAYEECGPSIVHSMCFI